MTNPGIIFDENIVLNDCYIDDGQTAFIPAIFTGDCNVQNYSELDPLICGYHFHDAFLAAHPISDSESPILYPPDFWFNVDVFKFKAGLPRRLDYLFVRGVEVKEGLD